jgi:hypothetical protein
MSTRLSGTAAVCLAAIVGFTASLSAQNRNRFEILSRDSMNDAGGLRITIIRDNQLSACFAVFMVEPPTPPPAPQVDFTPSPAELARQDTILQIRYAAERRDRQLAQLNAEFTRRAGRPYDSITSTSTYAVDPVLLGNYQQDLQKINQEYENVLLSLAPGTYPYAAPVPGMRTGGVTDASSALRLALLDPDPNAATRAMSNQFTSIENTLRQLIAAPRLAASGPFPCSNAAPAKPRQ